MRRKVRVSPQELHIIYLFFPEIGLLGLSVAHVQQDTSGKGLLKSLDQGNTGEKKKARVAAEE